MYVLEKRRESGYSISVGYDMNPPHPRQDEDNLGVIIGWYKGRPAGDKHNYRDVHEWVRDLMPRRRHPTVADLPGLALPIYIYEHGGIALRHRSILPDYRSTLFGYSYVSNRRLREERLLAQGKPDHVRGRATLDGELERYCQYLNGEVYQAVIRKECPHCHVANPDGVDEEVIGGGYDLDFVLQDAMSIAKELAGGAVC